jgi:DNA-binding CsgD family transcriptional regulator
MPGRPWTRSQLLELRRLHDEGKPATEIARLLNRSAHAIRTLKGTLGLRLYVQVGDEEEADIRALHADGMTDREIADLKGRHISTVRRILGIHLAAKTRWNEADTRWLYRLRREGLTYVEVGARMGRTPRACVMRFVNWERVKAEKSKAREKAKNARRRVAWAKARAAEPVSTAY